MNYESKLNGGSDGMQVMGFCIACWKNGCSGSCSGSCKGSCSGTCSGGCAGKCKNGCYGKSYTMGPVFP